MAKQTIKQQLLNRQFKQRGQGMTEYIIIVALIAVAAIGAFGYFGQVIRAQVGGMAQALAGTAVTANAGATTAAASAANESKGIGMSNYASLTDN